MSTDTTTPPIDPVAPTICGGENRLSPFVSLTLSRTYGRKSHETPQIACWRVSRYPSTGTDKAKSNFQFASWTYDTLRVGLPTSSTRYVQGVTGRYTVASTGYTSLGRPTGTKISLPASETPLPSTYTTTYTYTVRDQLLATQSDPRAQGLNNEVITYDRDALGMPTGTGSSAFSYVTGTVYTDYGMPSRVTMGASTNPAVTTYDFDDQTLRLKERVISRTQAPGPTVDDTKYSYDAVGNPTSIRDEQSETGSTVTDQQCYSYDALDRLTDAWTANDSCNANPPTSSTLTTAPGSYWQSFSYDAIGNRHQSVDHAIGTTGTTSTTNYADGCTVNCNPTGTQPHTLTATTGGTNPTTFAYDDDGNLHTRTPSTGPGQTLTWDDEGHLAQVDTTGASSTTTKYLYDADGKQLIRRDPGQTTLFAGDTEIVVNTSVTPNTLLGAIRTYRHGGTGNPVAIRSSLTGGGVKYLFGDAHGTSTLAMDTTTQQVARQQYTPYGQPRSSANTVTWPDPTHSYLGAPQDKSTGYTDIGARKYDPSTGSFISADPIFEATSPQQLGGYTYAADNPITGSDPTGLMLHWTQGGGDGTKSAQTLDPIITSSQGGTHTSSPHGGSWLDTVFHTVANETKKTVVNMLAAPYRQFQADKQCVTSGDNCMQLLAQFEPSLAASNAVVGRGSEIYGDFAHGRSAEGTGKLLFDAALILVAKGAGAETEAETAEARSLVESPKCSFAPATPVLIANGKTKPIGDIKPGDKVEAADSKTGKHQGTRTVTHVWINHDHDLLDLTVRTKNGHTATLHTTANHPFWDDTTHSWVPAGKLRHGDALNTATNGHAYVVATQFTPGTANRWNLTVQQLHTYYVLAGGVPILVHNCNADIPNVALGIRKGGGLESFASKNGYTHFLNDTLEGALGNVRDVANEHPETTIHVRLDQFEMTDGSEGTAVQRLDDAVRQGQGDNWYTTQREMAFLERAFRVGNLDSNRLRFYEGGQDISDDIFEQSHFFGGR
ncbi:polymorphic toxin-type HINT domain-containing protein [Streptomyces sp. NPDC085596]|uniref:polymorphic toxin-type HINT domain-containing protein n=1 Tax=Streptomyces sp. NPDC085596 TaxID=3365731 RepID=UPI0037D25A66